MSKFVPDFVPYDSGDDGDIGDGDDDRLDLLDDTAVPGTGIPRWLQLLGPGLLVGSIGSFCVGLVVGIPQLESLAVICFIGALLRRLVRAPIAFADLLGRLHRIRRRERECGEQCVAPQAGSMTAIKVERRIKLFSFRWPGFMVGAPARR